MDSSLMGYHCRLLLFSLLSILRLSNASSSFSRNSLTERALQSRLHMKTEQLIELRAKYNKLRRGEQVSSILLLKEKKREYDCLEEKNTELCQKMHRMVEDHKASVDETVKAALTARDEEWSSKLEDEVQQRTDLIKVDVERMKEEHNNRLRIEREEVQELKTRLLSHETHAKAEIEDLKKHHERQLQTLRSEIQGKLEVSFQQELQEALRRKSRKAKKQKEAAVRKAVLECNEQSQAELEKLMASAAANLATERRRSAKAVEHEKDRMRKLVEGINVQRGSAQ